MIMPGRKQRTVYIRGRYALHAHKKKKKGSSISASRKKLVKSPSALLSKRLEMGKDVYF